MINERPNNNINWKNRLEELESSADGTFNKEAAWEKLHTRLQSKPRNKKIIWYWLAAACLFFALFMFFFLSNKKENVLVKNNVLQKKIIPTQSQHVPIVTKDTSAVVSSLTAKNKKTNQSIKDIDKINTVINHKAIQIEIVQNKKEEIIAHEIENNAAMPVDTVISIAATFPEKKKLKVIHINELSDPAAETPNVARSSEHYSLEFKFINQKVYTESTGNSHITGFNIFKTKSPPSN